MTHEWKQSELVEQLHNTCGVKEGDILIVHSSAAAVGQVEGGVYGMLNAIKAALTPEGTLLMPVFSKPNVIFKMKRTPSYVGLLTEALRRAEGTIRSKHPTHSMAAWGKRAAELCAGHELTTGVGLNSPLHKAADAGAGILHIGCRMDSCTMVHLAEAMVRVPYLGKVSYPGYHDTVLTFVDYDGSERKIKLTDNPGDGNGFLAVQEEMERRGLILHGKFGDALTLKFGSNDCLNVAKDMLKKDIGAVLCKHSTCCVCVPSRKIADEWNKAHGL